MAKFTLHNEYGDFMFDNASTLETAKKKCDEKNYKCKVFQTYYAPSSFYPFKIVEHGKEVYRNF